MHRWIGFAAALLLVLPAGLTTSAPASAAASSAHLEPDIAPLDWEAPIVAPPGTIDAIGTQGVLDSDPLGLVPKLPFVQRYSLDTDHFEVWLCGDTGYTMNEAIADLENGMADYYSAISGGRYEISFSAGGTLLGDPNCLGGFQGSSPAYTTVGSPEGLLIIDSITGGGYASPGIICLDQGNCEWISATFPDNGRYAIVGANALSGFPSVAVHEVGHTLHWPHSNSGQSEYDNPLDLMSGNETLGGWTEPLPYGTLAFNRYQSGWVDPGDVVIAGAAYEEVELQPFDRAGTQMVAVLTGTDGVFYTLGARTSSTYDPIPGEWEGVEVYLVDHRCPSFNYPCPGIYRDQTQAPPSPNGVGHVLQVGESVTLDGTTVEVISRSGSGFVVAIGDPGNTLPFIDIAASAFITDIVWLEAEDVTKGCNPPHNTRFCPESTVTRGEMAAFLVRVLGLTDDGGGNMFIDDDGSIFEDDIAKLAAAGITKGCNPAEGNTKFCPNAKVTREQMAAFLVRAYALTDNGGNQFIDDDGSIFEDDIAKLAAAGITKGCNPPANTEFCPRSLVTREQMAAFLHRAAG
ncbi:MAG: S-layer homology domain-containing protein [Acidimicrobiia bacterium]|nr:S-layer homology domain-containing protein [Acidimicrobiia bacterium]